MVLVGGEGGGGRPSDGIGIPGGHLMARLEENCFKVKMIRSKISLLELWLNQFCGIG